MVAWGQRQQLNLLIFHLVLIFTASSFSPSFAFKPSTTTTTSTLDTTAAAATATRRKRNQVQMMSAPSPSSSSSEPSKHILYDLPVSNNGARCRLIVYKKALPQNEVAIVSPAELGGLQSEEYLKVNPQGKMPSLLIQESNFAIAESDTISRYLMSTYATTGPSFQPDNPRSNLMARFHDLYLTTIQGCLYKPSPPFGTFGDRKAALLEYKKQLQIIDDLVVPTDDSNKAMYLCGNEISYADATIFPSLVFAKYMFPKFNGSIEGLEDANNNPLPDKLDQYLERVRTQDPAFQKVYDEVR